ncbi:MAG: glucosamine-6-phosphate deaminase [Candidatus Acidiferrum sp.]
MLLIEKRDKAEIARDAALLIAGAMRRKPSMTLGFATGGTMVSVYRELVSVGREESLDFSQITTFNLDEYLGLPPSHPQSFSYFMRKNLFSHLNFDSRKIHIPDGTIRGDYESYCASYELDIEKAGGIDLQILGIGRNGHIGFNEPMSSFGSMTRLKVLTSETIEDNRSFFGPNEEIPRCAITMGIGTILKAKKILLVATGASKAEMVAKSIEGAISSAVTASALQLHPDVTFLVDQAAAAQLAHREYYARVLEMTKLLTPERLS